MEVASEALQRVETQVQKAHDKRRERRRQGDVEPDVSSDDEA